MKLIYDAEIFPEGDLYVARCRELDVSSFGGTSHEAGIALNEAVEAFLEGCRELGTLDEILEESGLVHQAS